MNLDMQNSTLVIGVNGLIGKAVATHLKENDQQVLGTTRRHKIKSKTELYLDLKEIRDWRCPQLVDTAIFCAGITKLKECKENPLDTAIINVTNSCRLIERLTKEGIFVVFLSTNRVFDGNIPYRSIYDAVCPMTEYGRQKAEVEKRILQNNLVAVLRFTKIIPPYPYPSLLSEWVKTLSQQKTIHPFSDMSIAPVALDRVVRTILDIATSRASGLYHLSGDKDITYSQIAFFMASKIQANPSLVQPITVQDSETIFEHIPQYTTLDCQETFTKLNLKSVSSWKSIKYAIF